MTQKQKDAIKIIADAIRSGNLSTEDATILIEAMMEGSMIYYTYPTQPHPLEPVYQKEWTTTCNTDE